MLMEKYRIKNNPQAGFTLTELLMVLSIISIVLFIAVGFADNSLENIEMNNFIQVFESDVLYTQNASLGTRKNIRIIFRDYYYTIIHEDTAINDIRRDYPSRFKGINVTQNRIAFSNGGTLLNPSTIKFRTGRQNYNLVFPLGKGRYYIAE